jgi:hypothetical protein
MQALPCSFHSRLQITQLMFSLRYIKVKNHKYFSGIKFRISHHDLPPKLKNLVLGAVVQLN